MKLIITLTNQQKQREKSKQNNEHKVIQKKHNEVYKLSLYIVIRGSLLNKEFQAELKAKSSYMAFYKKAHLKGITKYISCLCAKNVKI